MRVRLIVTGLLLIALAGCGNAKVASLSAWGANHKVTFYPPGGTPEVFHAQGVVESEEQSDGCYFKDRSSGRIVRLTGTVKIEIE